VANLLQKLLSIGGDKQLKQYSTIVEQINGLEASVQKLSDEELKRRTDEFKQRIANEERRDKLLPEVFATVREASVRTTGMRHFDVQLIGGMALDAGLIAEMKTGEGKTLVSTLAAYLNALYGQGVHVVTVNDYLAKRDSEWMGQIYRFLGLEVGLLQNGMKIESKIPAYKADITYGTNSEFGFDYLRDNMVMAARNRMQRGHHYAIVDEVDSILIDEARTPLIISGAGTRAADTYNRFARAVPNMKPDTDFDMDEAKRTIYATEAGLHKMEVLLSIEDLYADPTGQLVNHLNQALRAQFLFKRDVDYVVIDGEVKIVDEFTGRIMEGRRYSEGLHQALEAKERVLIREENQTLATITLQNYSRLYEKLSGMTGTAMTEESEFRQIYNLPVMAIPPNRVNARIDHNDLVYRTIDAKFNAVAEDVVERYKAGQPSLVGTVSIESSEKLSRLLDKRGIPHEVLNAKFHEREAHIVAQAGRVRAVTIATNMAGRGTDILLGGNPEFLAEEILINSGIDQEELGEAEFEKARAKALKQAAKITAEEHDMVIAAGGLAVIGTERHESRRIDNQLRGRSARQGDPGCTRFYLSLEDDLMRLFGGDRLDRIGSLMERSDMSEDTPIDSGMVSKAIESAQRQVEAMHFESRKRVLEYDDVMNLQRDAIYKERNAILDGKDIHARADEIIEDTVDKAVDSSFDDGDWNAEAFEQWLQELTGDKAFETQKLVSEKDTSLTKEQTHEYLVSILDAKRSVLGDDAYNQLESQVMLRIMDARWMNHLQDMDYLRAGIGLRAFGQRDPLTEYKYEAHEAFGELRDSMYDDYLRTLLRIQIVVPEEQNTSMQNVSYSGPSDETPSGVAQARSQQGSAGTAASATRVTTNQAVGKAKTVVTDKSDPYATAGRNDPCPCGSGKKFKKCHGVAA
jgi:preprotein translocase subunit SecA